MARPTIRLKQKKFGAEVYRNGSLDGELSFDALSTDSGELIVGAVNNCDGLIKELQRLLFDFGDQMNQPSAERIENLLKRAKGES